jgi:serine/threonine-protein kinase
MSAEAAPISVQLPKPGDLVGGKFVLESLLGQGGMGAVFKARHRTLGHEVAIKVMFADANNPEAAARFENEGRAAARIKSDHVMKVHDVDRELGYLYMVLELLEGEDLGQMLDKRRALPYAEAVAYVLEALEGVAQAHAMGIVHRDLKPSNLYLANAENGAKTIKVLDFGISKASNQSALNQSPSALTSTKAMLGSPLYMSPEQLRSSKSVDARADIWAFGIILFELITGTLPFGGESLGELFAAILETEAPLLSARASVPPGLDAIVSKCLQRRPENRFQSARELAAALAPFAQVGSGPFPVAPAYAPSQQTLPHHGARSANSPITQALPSSGGLPLGAMTPPGGGPPGVVAMPGAQTNATWQQSGSSGIPTSKAPLFAIAGLGAVVLIAGGALGVAKWSRGGSGTTASATAASAIVPAPPSAPVPAPVVPTGPASTTPSGEALAHAGANAVPAVASAAASTARPVAHTTTTTTRPTANGSPTPKPPSKPDVASPAPHAQGGGGGGSGYSQTR